MRPLLLLAVVAAGVPALAGCAYDDEYYGYRDRDEFCYDESVEIAHYHYRDDPYPRHRHHHGYRDRGHGRYHDRYDGHRGHHRHHRDRHWGH